MANATGESESDAVRLDFDRRLMLHFRGASCVLFSKSERPTSLNMVPRYKARSVRVLKLKTKL
jgi:hypothetical protein